MEKYDKMLTFENGTLTSPAKVEVSGTIYEVTPEQYTGTTPTSAENFNLMQKNAYDKMYADYSRVNEQNYIEQNGVVKDPLIPHLEKTVLFNGNVATGTFTFTDDPKNYKFLDVFCYSAGGSQTAYFSDRIYAPYITNTARFRLSSSRAESNIISVYTILLGISGTTGTIIGNHTSEAGGASGGADNESAITLIIGWK